jgi:hypothetical protein
VSPPTTTVDADSNDHTWNTRAPRANARSDCHSDASNADAWFDQHPTRHEYARHGYATGD